MVEKKDYFIHIPISNGLTEVFHNNRDSVSFPRLIDMLGAHNFKANHYIFLPHIFFSLANRPKEAQNLYYKSRFIQREFLKKNVISFAHREVQL